MKEGKAYTVKQLAMNWGTNVRTVRRLIKAGKLEAFSISAKEQGARASGIRISEEAKRKCEAANKIVTSAAASSSDDRADIGLPTSIM